MSNIIDMARKARLNVDDNALLLVSLTHFADLVRADEREACAKFCETNQVWVGHGKRGFSEWGNEDFVTGGRHQGMDYAQAIRARSKNQG